MGCDALNKIKGSKKLESYKLKDITNVFGDIKERLETLDFEGRQKLIRQLIDTIVVFPDELIIKAKVPAGVYKR